MMPVKTVFFGMKSCHGSKKKVGIIVLFWCNADGSEKVPFVIGSNWK